MNDTPPFVITSATCLTADCNRFVSDPDLDFCDLCLVAWLDPDERLILEKDEHDE